MLAEKMGKSEVFFTSRSRIHLIYCHLPFTFLVDALAGIRLKAVTFILIAATLTLVFLHWLFGVIWRAFDFMRREVTNPVPLIPKYVCVFRII